MSLTEKINYEFQCFYLDQMRTSKENIFAHSREIELKKKIKDELHLLAETVSEPEKKMLSVQNNLLESAYCYFHEIAAESGTENMGETARRWLSFVLKKQDSGQGRN